MPSISSSPQEEVGQSHLSRQSICGCRKPSPCPWCAKSRHDLAHAGGLGLNPGDAARRIVASWDFFGEFFESRAALQYHMNYT